MIAYKLADLKKIYISYIAAICFSATVILFKKASQDTLLKTLSFPILYTVQSFIGTVCVIFSARLLSFVQNHGTRSFEILER